MAEKAAVKERTLEETPTWAVAVVFFVLIAISICIELLIHIVGKVSNKLPSPTYIITAQV